MIKKIEDWPFPEVSNEFKRGNKNFFEITKDVFEQQLGVLPPMRPEWSSRYTIFFCPEEYTFTDEGPIHTVYVEIKGDVEEDSRFYCKCTHIKERNSFYILELLKQLEQ